MRRHGGADEASKPCVVVERRPPCRLARRRPCRRCSNAGPRAHPRGRDAAPPAGTEAGAPLRCARYLFPFEKLLPSHIVGAISLTVLLVALLARYAFRMNGGWRSVYVITALMALYLNCFVAVVQSFLKVPALHALAPKGSEPPFAIAQLALLAIFITVGTLATRRFRGALLTEA